MRAILLAASASLAAVTVILPAQAQSTTAGAFVGVPAVNVHRGSGNFDFRRDSDRRRHHRGFDNGYVYLDREYQGDTLWRPNSFNDWWHERPDRSMPRWMQNNQNCERLWWSGGNWRC
jgi:hypothetical protein